MFKNLNNLLTKTNYMFLELAHTKLNVFITGKKLVLSCYKVSKLLPPDERFNMVQQLRRASLSIQLNIAEGSSRKSLVERKRFYEISRGSLIEVDTIFDLAEALQYVSKDELAETGILLIDTFKMLSRMISTETNNKE